MLAMRRAVDTERTKAVIERKRGSLNGASLGILVAGA